MESSSLRRERLEVTGQVQGVGFRPCVYRLARSLGLSGVVVNDASGAAIEVQGPAETVAAFARRLQAELPPLARIARCTRTALPIREDEKDFVIGPSAGGELADAQVTVDTATCADCLKELFDPSDPRYRYPFINCTNCGPRYSIIRRIPYDRPNTTMVDFALCPTCAGQYADPSDRRFHAQPIACPACGPSCRLTDTHGRPIECDDPVASAAALLADGKIVAIKGLGGFHIACRADDDHVVRRLRMRKHRDAKPFALMVRDLNHARQICIVTPEGEGLLSGPIRPIVLLDRRPGGPVAESVAPGLATLGIMLPYTPVHHLLFDTLSRDAQRSASPDQPRGHANGACPPYALVMTSGNVADEPLVRRNEDAVAHLAAIADAMLLHDRPIERSLDDSVVMVFTGRACNLLHAEQSRVQASPSAKDLHALRTAPRIPPLVLRRARGYAPRPIAVPNVAGPPVLAVGGELKNAVCLYRDGRAVLSEHIGDLKDARTYRRFVQVTSDLEQLFDLSPAALAADEHPGYLSTEYALRRSRGELSGRPALPLVRVQHHHAHVVGLMAEHGRTDEAVGLACDGVGYGPDGAIWGCEVLRASPAGYTRLGHLRYYSYLGGDAAAHETFRPALALLRETFGEAVADLPILRRMEPDAARRAALLDSLAAGVNCVPTSSLGRLFDAAAALCLIARENRYEGEAPMLLESAAGAAADETYPFEITHAVAPEAPRTSRQRLSVPPEPFEIDWRPMIESMVSDLDAGTAPGAVAGRFHNTVADFLAAAARRAAERTGLRTIALTGGCFANRTVMRRLVAALRADGLEVLTHHEVPCGDGGIALGQAIVAAWRLGNL